MNGRKSDTEIARVATRHGLVVRRLSRRLYLAAPSRLGARAKYGATAVDALTLLRHSASESDRRAIEAALAALKEEP